MLGLFVLQPRLYWAYSFREGILHHDQKLVLLFISLNVLHNATIILYHTVRYTHP